MGRSTGLTGYIVDAYTGYLALKRLIQSGYGLVAEIVVGILAYGTGQVGFLLYTVTDYYNLINILHYLVQCNDSQIAVAGTELFGLVTDIRNHQNRRG